jgi:hypothetical protein
MHKFIRALLGHDGIRDDVRRNLSQRFAVQASGVCRDSPKSALARDGARPKSSLQAVSFAPPDMSVAAAAAVDTLLMKTHPIRSAVMAALADAIPQLRLCERRLLRYMHVIGDTYLASNPYHNAHHASQAVLLTAALVRKTPSREGRYGMCHVLAAVVAAAAHDANHPGTTNTFLIVARAPLAIIYNDQSVIENHSARQAVELLCQDATDFLAGSQLDSPDARAYFRSLVVGAVLGTDMTRHREVLRAFSAADERSDLTVLQMCVKCADLGHCAAPRALHCEWVRRLQEEFTAQGRRESAASLRVSPLMDPARPQLAVPANQVVFMDSVVLPMFARLEEALPDAAGMLRLARANRDDWQADASRSGPTGLCP